MSSRSQFDPERSWQGLEERIKIEKDPRCRQLLEQVRDHMRTEIRGELPALMATLVDEPSYHLWGLPVEAGPFLPEENRPTHSKSDDCGDQKHEWQGREEDG